MMGPILASAESVQQEGKIFPPIPVYPHLHCCSLGRDNLTLTHQFCDTTFPTCLRIFKSLYGAFPRSPDISIIIHSYKV